jgi:UDP-glucose 4-epimerase
MTLRLCERYFVVGGAGFIGSHIVDRLLAHGEVERVTVYDNFSSGREQHVAHHADDPRFEIRRADVNDSAALRVAMEDHDVVIHLASNPDISRAAVEPAIDFEDGTQLTHLVLEAMRQTSARRILYASGSGVYGDLGGTEIEEDWGPLLPVSTYGASKLAGEGLICAYCAMFGLSARSLRFANVIGPRQTHGVALDFVRSLLDDPRTLRILGDGKQTKSYVHVHDAVEAMMVAHCATGDAYQVFNVATGDYLTVTEIADLAAESLGISADVRYDYVGGARGWKGDIPVVRLDAARIRSLGWRCERSSRDAMIETLTRLAAEARAPRRYGD